MFEFFLTKFYRGLDSKIAKKFKASLTYRKMQSPWVAHLKDLACRGLRFGWLITKEPTIYNELLNLKTYTSMCSTQTSEYLGLMAVQAAPKLLDRNLKIIKENLRAADAFFKKWKSQFHWIKPQAGSVSVFKTNELSAENFVTGWPTNLALFCCQSDIWGTPINTSGWASGKKTLKNILPFLIAL